MKQPNKRGLWHEMNWKKIEYSKNQIKLAGSAIAKDNYSKISREDARKIVNNWRASHAYPLQVFYINCKRKVEGRGDAIAVQRIKRLDSIINKLKRMESMSLLRMQDLGGCRIIVENVKDVYDVIESFKKSRIRHQLVREYDYIQSPKKSGYRCVHLVYKYFSDKKTDYNGILIEIQIRTRLQHLWATAIEVLGIYTKHNLKASQGDLRILRFMELISALFSIEEGTAISENTPGSLSDILLELNSLSDTNVLKLIGAVNIAIGETKRSKEGYYLLTMNHNTSSLSTNYFKKSEFLVATEMYEQVEQDSVNENIDAVLVSASSIETVKKAYPNYFVDVSAFIEKVEQLWQQ